MTFRKVTKKTAPYIWFWVFGALTLWANFALGDAEKTLTGSDCEQPVMRKEVAPSPDDRSGSGFYPSSNGGGSFSENGGFGGSGGGYDGI